MVAVSALFYCDFITILARVLSVQPRRNKMYSTMEMSLLDQIPNHWLNVSIKRQMPTAYRL